jgi:hypothetical protein
MFPFLTVIYSSGTAHSRVELCFSIVLPIAIKLLGTECTSNTVLRAETERKRMQVNVKTKAPVLL